MNKIKEAFKLLNRYEHELQNNSCSGPFYVGAAAQLLKDYVEREEEDLDSTDLWAEFVSIRTRLICKWWEKDRSLSRIAEELSMDQEQVKQMLKSTNIY